MDADGRRRTATRRPAFQIVQSFVCALLGAVCWLPPASADEIRFASRRDWQAWPLPGTVELTPQGGLKPIAARRNINAALNAAGFGGGITAGSGRTIAFFVTRCSFGFNFYEVLGSDGSVAPDGSLIWQKYYSGTASEHVKKVTGAATHEFGLVPTRFIRVLWKSWDASNRWAFRGFAEELQVFGEGFPQNLAFRSHIMDFQSPKILNALSWEADIPPGARLELRSRSGDEVENLRTTTRTASKSPRGNTTS